MSKNVSTSHSRFTGIIAMVSALIAIFGGWLFYSNTQAVQDASNLNSIAYDESGLAGTIGRLGVLIGLVIMVVAGLVAIIFFAVYFKIKRSVKQRDALGVVNPSKKKEKKLVIP